MKKEEFMDELKMEAAKREQLVRMGKTDIEAVKKEHLAKLEEFDAMIEAARREHLVRQETIECEDLDYSEYDDQWESYGDPSDEMSILCDYEADTL